MKHLLIMAALWAASFAVSADTFYVRTDGGTSSQCTGLADAAYDGAGTGEACAYSTPAIGVANIAGGDTLIIKNGSYEITTAIQPPSGSASAYTRILGEQHGACRAKPELWGSGGVNRLITLSNRSFVEVACLEITDHADCAYQHYNSTHACNSSDAYAQNGIYAYSALEIILRDLNIHGLAANAYKGGKVENFTLERVRMVANGDAGFHGASTTSADDSFSGTILLKNVEIAWNGCTEDYPSLAIIACYSEIGSGYGDGLGTKDTSGTWIIEDSYVHHNTSDGLDLRYTKLPGAEVIIRRSWFYNNAGNQVKAWGKFTMENSFVNSYCGYFGTRYGQAIDPDTGDLATTPETCRASGNAVIVIPVASSTPNIVLRYNTIAGHSLALVQFAEPTPNTSVATSARLENNVFVGGTTYNNTGLPKFTSNSAEITIGLYNNHVYNASSVSCTASQCVTTNPLLRNQTISAFDPRPQSGSPVLGAGNTSYTTPATDIMGRPRPAAPARGAFEYAP